MNRLILAPVSLLATAAAFAQAPAVPGDHEVWELARTATTLQWLVIHNLDEGEASGVFHVEVLERRLRDPVWRFTRVAAHLAITPAALRASVRKPLQSGQVYPEHFNDAFAEWKKQRDAGKASTCDTTVRQCLKPK